MSPLILLGGALIGVLAAFAAVPVIIHLINMLRHRRVKWAAMDFLLQSYKRNRNWIFLKQLLLLLARMSVMVLAAVMLCVLVHWLMNQVSEKAGWQDSPIAAILGGQRTHHYVLLDDSYSMSDRSGSMTAFERARKALQLIAQRAGKQEKQQFTLIRYSQAAGVGAAADKELAMEQVADLNAQAIDKDFDDLLERRRNTIDVSQLAVGPKAGLRVIQQLVEQRKGEQAIVYVVSDFRAKEWDNPAEIEKTLRSLKQLDAEIQLVSCVREERPNLAIVDLQAEMETRAAGLALPFNVSVKNHGKVSAKKIRVKLRSFVFDPQKEATGGPDLVQGQVNEVATVLFDEIRPGETETMRVPVYLPQAGRHVVEATLPEDPVSTDNRRWNVVQLLPGVPVLLVDDRATRRSAYFLESAFKPSDRSNTGVLADVQSAAFVRDASPEVLRSYHAIYLLDVESLDDRALSNLEQYVREGGGLAIYAGPNVNIKYYNANFYKDGKGLFPLPLDRRDVLPEKGDAKLADIKANDHPAFATFLSERNTILNYVNVKEFIRPPVGWSAAEDGVQVAAELRNGNPLVVERNFGEGRVVAILTTVTRDWNNWHRSPAFVIMLLKLQAHLASNRHPDVPKTVAPIELPLETEQYRADVTFVVPGQTEKDRVKIDKMAHKSRSGSPLMSAWLGQDEKNQTPNKETERSGVYEAWMVKTDGSTDVRRWAVNVDQDEGDLTVTTPQALVSKLDQVEAAHVHWDEFDPAQFKRSGIVKFGRWILLVLFLLLIGEQILAYAVSYHPKRGGAE